MQLFFTISLLLLGLIFIIYGGNILIKNAVKISLITGIPEILIGATIVSLATTLPELSVTIYSSIGNLANMAIGNAIGSVIFNLTIIVGCCMVFSPQATNVSKIKKDFYILLFSTLLFFVLAKTGHLNVFSGIVLLIIFATYFTFNIIFAVKQIDFSTVVAASIPSHYKKQLFFVACYFLIGTFFITIGGKLLVENGERLANYFNIGEHIVGVGIIAVGTSMPEIVTCISSIKQKSTAIVVGNIIGANILSFTLLLGTICITNSQLSINENLLYFALPTIFLATLIIYIPSTIKKKLTRGQGLLLLALATAYYFTLFFFR